MSAQILHESKTKWRVAPKRKTGAAAISTCLTEQRCSHRWTIEPWNHWIMEPLNEKSQIDQECSLLPGISRQQTMTRTLILYVFCFFWWCNGGERGFQTPLWAFTSGRRTHNASSEWNGQKTNIIVNLWQMYATVVVKETNVCIDMKALQCLVTAGRIEYF